MAKQRVKEPVGSYKEVFWGLRQEIGLRSFNLRDLMFPSFDVPIHIGFFVT